MRQNTKFLQEHEDRLKQACDDLDRKQLHLLAGALLGRVRASVDNCVITPEARRSEMYNLVEASANAVWAEGEVDVQWLEQRLYATNQVETHWYLDLIREPTLYVLAVLKETDLGELRLAVAAALGSELETAAEVANRATQIEQFAPGWDAWINSHSIVQRTMAAQLEDIRDVRSMEVEKIRARANAFEPGKISCYRGNLDPVHFVATHADLLAVLEEVEAKEPLKYVEAGVFDIPTKRQYARAAELPAVGTSSTTYLVAKAKSLIQSVAEPDPKTGRERCAWVLRANPASVLFTPGGLAGDGVLRRGEVSSTWPNMADLLHHFREAVERFQKVGDHYVGPEASQLIQRGWHVDAQ